MRSLRNTFLIILCLALLLPLTLLMSGCGNEIEIQEDEPLYVNTAALLEALVTDDKDGALSLLPSQDGEQLYQIAKSVLGESSKIISLSVNLAEGGSLDGREFRAMELLVVTDTDSFYVESMVYTDSPSYIPDFDVERIPRIVENNGAQAVFVVLGCLSAAFALWMFIDCAVKCKEKKWLWLILIAVGMFSLSIGSATASSGIAVTFGWTNLSSITFWDDGTFHVSVMIPVAAFAWLALRGKASSATAADSSEADGSGTAAGRSSAKADEPDTATQASDFTADAPDTEAGGSSTSAES